MNPRMKSSKKSTAFPKEYTDQIEAVFRENFAAHLKKAQLIVEGRIYPHEVLLRVGLRQEGALRQANFEVSMEYSAEDKDALERIHNCVDAAASMMLEFVESESEPDFPLSWKEFPFQDRKLFLKYSTENSDLEAEANRLLGLHDGSLLAEEPEDEDVPVEERGPRMFGGPLKASKKKKDDLH